MNHQNILNEPYKKYYTNNQLFQIILPDGSGNIYYPNGDLAILINDGLDYQNFIVFNNQKSLGQFDSDGNCYFNFLNEKLQLN